MIAVADIERLCCPASGQPLTLLDTRTEDLRLDGLAARADSLFGCTTQVLVRADTAGAYPVVRGIPVLLEPEMLAVGRTAPADLDDPRWAEAYLEMGFYSQAADQTDADQFREVLSRARNAPPWSAEWVDAPYDAAAQYDALRFLGGRGGVVLQLGGKGLHAVKALLAGSEKAWLITPMLSEALYARQLAEREGVADRFVPIVGIAEQLPLQDGTADAIYAGGCLHHMDTTHAAPEIRRVLASGGHFAAVEPWSTALNRIGTKLLGKREPNAHCHPLDRRRLDPLFDTFGCVRMLHHGPLLRYLALTILKITGREISPRTGLWLDRIDDSLPLPSRWGGSVAVLARKE